MRSGHKGSKQCPYSTHLAMIQTANDLLHLTSNDGMVFTMPIVDNHGVGREVSACLVADNSSVGRTLDGKVGVGRTR